MDKTSRTHDTLVKILDIIFCCDLDPDPNFFNLVTGSVFLLFNRSGILFWIQISSKLGFLSRIFIKAINCLIYGCLVTDTVAIRLECSNQETMILIFLICLSPERLAQFVLL